MYLRKFQVSTTPPTVLYAYQVPHAIKNFLDEETFMIWWTKTANASCPDCPNDYWCFKGAHTCTHIIHAMLTVLVYFMEVALKETTSAIVWIMYSDIRMHSVNSFNHLHILFCLCGFFNFCFIFSRRCSFHSFQMFLFINRKIQNFFQKKSKLSK